MGLRPKPGQVTATPPGPSACGQERAQGFTDIGELGQAGEGEPRGGPLRLAKVTTELSRGFFVAETLLPTPFP